MFFHETNSSETITCFILFSVLDCQYLILPLDELALHSAFLSTSKGPHSLVNWWGPVDWSPVPLLVQSGHRPEMVLQIKVFWLISQRLRVKKFLFLCHYDRVMHRIHQNERRRRTNKFFSQCTYVLAKQITKKLSVFMILSFTAHRCLVSKYWIYS